MDIRLLLVSLAVFALAVFALFALFGFGLLFGLLFALLFGLLPPHRMMTGIATIVIAPDKMPL